MSTAIRRVIAPCGSKCRAIDAMALNFGRPNLALGSLYSWTPVAPTEDPPDGMGWVVRTGSTELYLIDRNGAYVYAPLEASA